MRTKPIHICILQAEAKHKKLCKDKNKPENHIEPPPNETANQRKVHRGEIHISLLGENEEKQRLEKIRTANRKRDRMLQKIMVTSTSPPRINMLKRSVVAIFIMKMDGV